MSQIFEQSDLADPLWLDARVGQAVLIANPAHDKSTGSEDVAGFWDLDSASAILAVADGMGGGPAGARAASIAIRALDESLESAKPDGSLRSRIVDAFEAANQRVLELGVGAGTTLVVVEIHGETARPFHAGDSGAILVGQRGRIGFETMSHSPVGYGMASGILEPDDLHHHEERHLLSNCVGSHEMRVEVGAPVRMAARDTLMLASDGVFDNFRRAELIELIRSGDLDDVARQVQARVQSTMRGEDPGLPAHPDDATAVFYRPASRPVDRPTGRSASRQRKR